MARTQDTYMEPIIMQDAGYTIRIYRPILDDAERERRMKRIRQAAADLIKECIKVHGPQWLEENR